MLSRGTQVILVYQKNWFVLVGVIAGDASDSCLPKESLSRCQCRRWECEWDVSTKRSNSSVALARSPKLCRARRYVSNWGRMLKHALWGCTPNVCVDPRFLTARVPPRVRGTQQSTFVKNTYVYCNDATICTQSVLNARHLLLVLVISGSHSYCRVLFSVCARSPKWGSISALAKVFLDCITPSTALPLAMGLARVVTRDSTFDGSIAACTRIVGHLLSRSKEQVWLRHSMEQDWLRP